MNNPVQTTDGLGESAISALIAAQQAALFRFVLFISQDPSLAEDITQETLIIALDKLHRQGPEGDIGKWLRGIARNVFRRQKAKSRLLLMDEETLEMAEEFYLKRTGGTAEESPYMTALKKCLQLVDNKDREMLELRYTQNPGREALSQTLGISVPALESRMKRTKNQLKKCVEKRTASLNHG
ncbi:MAG: sigma-70 family RNA polymerase sigma factor [Planctomycetes bacterium]|nr:sigma-70 family RNA polymerase sigma factor [Planctomycetota bacterium]